MDFCVVLLSFLLLYGAVFLFLKSTVPDGARCLHILLITPETTNLEQMLRWNFLCVGYCVLLGGGTLLIADSGMTDEQRALVALYANKRELVVLPVEELPLAELALHYNQIRIVA